MEIAMIATEFPVNKLFFNSPAGKYQESFVRITNAKMPLGGVFRTMQAHDYSCGAATVTTILRLFGDLVFENPTAKDLETEDGTNHLTMVRYLESRGLRVKELTHVSNEQLRKIIQARQVAMFFSQGWDDNPPAEGYSRDFWGLGHVMIPIGECDQGFLFSDTFSSCGTTLIPYDQLDKVWHYQTYDPSYDPKTSTNPPKRYTRPLYVVTKKGMKTPPNLLPFPRECQYATLLK